MEDPDTEWEVQEYSPSKEGGVTKVRWILNKGLWLGKKVVITGVAISSAPLVLPPLMVCSAMGFAFSVPFGLVFASYACTDKLMSKLLPTPEPYSILEYYTDEDEEAGKEGFGKFVMEEEEEEDLEDIKRGVGMRICMDEDDDYWQKDVDSWEEQPTVYSDENVKEEGYEEDVGDYWQKDVDRWEEQPTVYSDGNVEEEGYEEDVGEYVEVEDDYDQEIEMRDEKLEEDAQEIEMRDERERAVEETPVPFEGGDVKLGRPNENIDQNIALEYQKRNVPANVEQVGEAHDKGFDNGNTVGYVNGTLGAKSFGGDLDSIKKQKPEVHEKLPVREERAADNDSIYKSEEMTSKEIKENVISSNADMREIADESGFDLFDERSAPSDQKSYAAMHATDDFNASTIEVNVDFMALPTTVRVFDSSHVKNALEKDEAPASQVLLKEEKIWEQIDAMRAIVGYGATPHRNFREELEALYIFTGVEPPVSSKDPSDLADINHKLRFLMSIVGVK